jgi:hypothetical protein
MNGNQIRYQQLARLMRLAVCVCVSCELRPRRAVVPMEPMTLNSPLKDKFIVKECLECSLAIVLCARFVYYAIVRNIIFARMRTLLPTGEHLNDTLLK